MKKKNLLIDLVCVLLSLASCSKQKFDEKLPHESFLIQPGISQGYYHPCVDGKEDFELENDFSYVKKDGEYQRVDSLYPGDEITIYYTDDTKSEISFLSVDYPLYAKVSRSVPPGGTKEDISNIIDLLTINIQDFDGAMQKDGTTIKDQSYLESHTLYAAYREEVKEGDSYHIFGLFTFDPSTR